MTVILPTPTSVGTQVGRSLGQGIQQGGEIAFNRGLLQKGLESLKNLSPDASPLEVTTSLINATHAIPGAERYVGQILPQLLAFQASRQKASPGIGGAAPGREGEGTQMGQPPNLQEIQSLLGEKFFPQVQLQEQIAPGQGQKPQKPLTPPTPIGPAEEAKIRNTLQKRGITQPAVIDEQIDKIKKYQNDYYASQKEGFQNVEQYQEAKRARDSEFFKNAELPLGQSHGTMTPSEKAIWSELSRQYEDLPDTQRFSSTEQLYNNLVGGPLIEFENSQQGLPIGSQIRSGEVTHRLSDARTSIQDHLRRIEDRQDLPRDLKGVIKNELRDQYFRAMGEKDFGVAQAAYATSNLSPETAKAVPIAPSPTKVPFGQEFLAEKGVRDKYTYSLANALTKIKPDDSLILLREKALANNYDDKAFNEALNLAINQGRLELSDYQAKERNKLSIPQRLDLDTIMTGRRSIWDLFKGKL